MSSIAELKAKLEQLKQASQPKPAPATEITIKQPTVQASSVDASKVLERIQRLKDNLDNKIPGWDSLLHSIHRELSKDVELTHLLKPEDIGVVVKAMCQKKNIVLVDEKSKAARKVSLKNTSVEDL